MFVRLVKMYECQNICLQKKMENSGSDIEDQQLSSSDSKEKLFYKLLMQKKPKEGSNSPKMKDSNLQTDLTNSPEKRRVEDNEVGLGLAGLALTTDYPIEYIDRQTLDVLDESLENKLVEGHIMNQTASKGQVNTTQVSLCCAMTENSKSPSHQASSYHMNENLKDIENSLDSSSESFRKVSCNNRKSSSFEERSNDVRQQSSSRSPTPSDISSCESSPLVTSSSTRLRRRLLSQRLSVDNLMVATSSTSLRHSSPDSSRSAPESSFKKRSTSHDNMIPRRDSQRGKVSVADSPKSKGKGLIASMESLAQNSLLAAQVLHLIPTTKARERNFLHGRIASNSLLGSVELERTLPNRELRIFVGTWNMNGQAPPRELNDFMLPEGLEHVPDLLVVGTQESFSERFEWEVSIQETIGPSHLLFHSAVLGTLHLAIFIRRDLLWFCSIPEEASYSTRPGTAFRTKGAVAIGFMLFGTSYLFITSHLTAHMDKAKERVHDVKRIIRSLDLPKLLPNKHKSSKDVTSNYDCVFWCGDLNFRLDQERCEVVDWVAKQEFPMSRAHNLRNDQLNNMIADGSIFREFQEGPIKFPPTYKYDPGTQNFDTSHKQRTPAYTDRILYKCRGRRESSTACGGNLDCLMYDSVSSITTSDHKPVIGVYKSIVRPGIDTIPLAAGQFNRDVFLEGIKRRAAAMTKMHDASTVCSVQ